MNIGRPVEFDPDRALESAMHLFWKKGYESTSLQDLIQAMNLSKSSFYQAFGSKHQLFLRSIKLYRDSVVDEMYRLLGKAGSGRKFIEESLLSIANETRGVDARRGCLVMNSANEFSQRDPVIADLIKKSTESFSAILEKAVVAAQENNEIAPNKDPKVLAQYLLTTMSGLKTMVKAGTSANTIRAIANFALKTLK